MYKHILVPVDLEQVDISDKSVQTAIQMAKDYSAVLHFLTVIPPLGSFAATYFPDGFAHKASDAAREKLHAFTENAQFQNLTVHHIVAHGAIYDQILAMGKKVDADLIVLASHRPGLNAYLLGPNAARVVRHAACTVMVVRD